MMNLILINRQFINLDNFDVIEYRPFTGDGRTWYDLTLRRTGQSEDHWLKFVVTEVFINQLKSRIIASYQQEGIK